MLTFRSYTVNRNTLNRNRVSQFLYPIGKGEHAVGDTLKTTILPYSSINQDSSTTVGVVPGDVTIATYDYTPKSSSSQIIIEYSTNYYLGGSGADNISSFIYMNNTLIGKGYQQWTSALGGGSRSGTVFPLIGMYDNNSIDTKQIVICVNNDTDSDPITINGDEGTWLKITEISK
jgi:hypothetical protein